MITMIAGSLPGIVTSGNNRRINRDGISDKFLNIYINLIYKLLKNKKDLKDIKISYIGGYEPEENLNTAKLYFKALNFYIKTLTGEELKIENFNIIDKKIIIEDTNKVKDIFDETDFLFLGIGDDKKLGEIFDVCEEYDINIFEYVNKRNILVASSCAGSVLSAKKIYGSRYDSFYHAREVFEYPDNYKMVSLNNFTMEPNLYPVSNTDEKNMEFKEKCLIPDSYEKCFFGCRQNSFIFMSGNIGYGVGEIYLFIDGKDYLINSENRIVNLSYLNSLVNLYNINKNAQTKEKIIQEVNKIRTNDMVNVLNNDAIYNYEYIEWIKSKKLKTRMLNLKINLLREIKKIFYGLYCVDIDSEKLNKEFLECLNLESDNNWEIFLKIKLIETIKKYSTFYNDDLKNYFDDLYEIMVEISYENSLIVYYFLNCFSSMYDNCKAKKLLKLTGLEPKQKVNVMSNNNKMLWRKFDVR